MSETASTSAPANTTLRIGAVVVMLFLLLGFVSIIWTPQDVASVNVGLALQDIGSSHWLGTDQLGRDVFSLLMKGMLTSFVVAAVAVFIGAVVGIPMGLVAAEWGGPAEWGILRLNDFLLALPAVIVAILMTTLAGPGAINTMIAVGLFNIPAFALAARGGAIRLKTLDYVAAARLAGQGRWEIARRHVLPNIAIMLLAQATMQLGVGVLAEAGLSFVGLGTQPPATSLGLMLKDAQSYLALKPMLAVVPGLTIVIIVLALNLASDGVRDLLEPRMRRIGGDRGAA